jgi:serine protease Do
MKRPSTVVLCGATLLLGLALGTQLQWRGAVPVHAEALDENAADQLYHELRSGSSPLQASSTLLAKIARVTTPAVVHIQSEHRTKRGMVEETGSGVIVDSERLPGRYVVTNRHVVDNTELNKIAIHLNDGRVIHPARMWTDSATDIAVLKVTASNLHAARWGSSRNLEIGHIVLAMGSPFGLSQSITFGIISAKGRRSLELGSNSEVINQDFLQTDAAINPGNSGGPLINLQGEVVGINTAIASNSGGNEGIAFSIPSDLVHQVVEQLLQHGKVTRAYLGVKLDPEFNATTASRLKLDRVRGARVVEVYPNTPAARAKLLHDDVILTFDGVEVQDENHLINMVSLTPVNRQVKMIVMRSGRKITLDVVLGDRVELEQRAEAPPQRPGTGVHIESVGLTVRPVEPDVAKRLGYPQSQSGLLVLKVDPRSRASGEVQIYDLIEEAARTPVHSADDLKGVVERSSDSLVLKVLRNSRGETESRLIMLPD